MQESCINVDVRLDWSVIVAMGMTVRVTVIVLSLMAFLVLEQVLLDLLVLDLAMVVGMSVRMPMIVSVTSVIVLVMSVTVVMIMIVIFSTEMIMSISRVQNLHLNQVENESHDGDDQHDVSLDLGRYKESLGCLREEPDGHDPD